MHLNPHANQIDYDEPQSSHINDNPPSNETNKEPQTSPKSGEEQKIN